MVPIKIENFCCKNRFRITDLTTFCSLDNGENRCCCCVFKKMLIILRKMTIFRLSKRDKFLDKFFILNDDICQLLIDKFTEIKLEDSRSDCDIISLSIDSEKAVDIHVNEHDEKAIQSLQKVQSPYNQIISRQDNKFYNIFKQIHIDDCNKCNYLEFIFESYSYLFHRGYAPHSHNEEDSVELLSIESNVKVSKFNSEGNTIPENEDLHIYITNSSRISQIESLTGLNSLKREINTYIPRELFQKMADFIAVFVQMIYEYIPGKWAAGSNEKMKQGKFCPYQIFNLCIRKYLTLLKQNEASGVKSESRDLVVHDQSKDKSLSLVYYLWCVIEDYTYLRQQLITLSFLWSYDHRSGKFYLNKQAYFSIISLKTKIMTYFSANKLQDCEAFISDLMTLARALSAKPKFQLVLIVIYITCKNTSFCNMYNGIQEVSGLRNIFSTSDMAYFEEFAYRTNRCAVGLGFDII